MAVREHRPSLRGWRAVSWLGTAGRPGCLSRVLCGPCTQAVVRPPQSLRYHVPHSPTISLVQMRGCTQQTTILLVSLWEPSLFCYKKSKASARDFLDEAPSQQKAPKAPTPLAQGRLRNQCALGECRWGSRAELCDQKLLDLGLALPTSCHGILEHLSSILTPFSQQGSYD